MIPLKLKNTLRRFLARANSEFEYQIRGKQKPSVYFYTVHKCASTLFSNSILSQVRFLKPIDYADRIYRGAKIEGFDLKENGRLYGPIRVTSFPDGPLYEPFVKYFTTPGFTRNKRCLFFFRDPRDVIVSSYYSFGWSHGLSQNPEVRKFQEQNRQQIQDQSLDAFALSEAVRARGQYELMAQLIDTCEDATVITYEQMIRGDRGFYKAIQNSLELSSATVEEIYKETRPVKKINHESHRRDGSIGGFRKELKNSTIERINAILENVLNRFGYPF